MHDVIEQMKQKWWMRSRFKKGNKVHKHPDYYTECSEELEIVDISICPATAELEYQCQLPNGSRVWLTGATIIGLGDTYGRSDYECLKIN